MTTSNLEVLAYEESPIGMICLRRRELLSEPGTVVTEIMLDHELLMSSCHTASERALATHALARHPGDSLRVLIGGLGLGYTAAEVLTDSRAQHVEVIELLPEVITWMRSDQLPLSAELNADARLHLLAGDAYARLATAPKGLFDLVLIDVDHSPDERLGDSNEGFYHPAGLEAAKAHLAPGGILGVWSYCESPRFERALRGVFAHVEVETVDFHNRVVNEPETNWIFLARD